MQGDSDSSLYLVQSGLLKAYYTADNGKEFIKSFVLEKDVIGSLRSVYGNGKCSFSLLCLEPTELIKLSIQKEKREYELLCLSAEE